jgi:crossover junction endodeoxyribonuclease RuvC
MRVLGVDPGLTRCGLGVVDGLPGRRATMVAVDVIRTPADADLAHRLLGISEAIEGWLAQVRPDVVAVERVFSQNNVATVMGTAQAAGVAILAAARLGIPVVLHTPSEVKAAVTGSGRAGKDQVANMVTRILGLAEAPRPADAADALALAICHLWRDGTSLVAATRAATSPVAGLSGVGGAGGATPAQRAWVEATQAAKAAQAAQGRSARRSTGPTTRR